MTSTTRKVYDLVDSSSEGEVNCISESEDEVIEMLDDEEEDSDNENLHLSQRNPLASIYCRHEPSSKEWIFSNPFTHFSIQENLGNMLYDYQRDGVGFILKNWAQPPCHGCVLADDMGMGKTIQSIAAMSAILHAPEKRALALLVVPLSVVDQWKRQLTRFLPNVHCEYFHGPKKQVNLDKLLKKKEHAQGGIIVLSTYDTVTNEVDFLLKLQWEILVLDEATRIKNSKTMYFKALRALAEVSMRRLALTATPFENNLGELWSLFDIACNGKLLGKKAEFERHFAGRIERQTRNKKIKSEDVGLLRAKMSKALHAIVFDYMLRRDKDLLKKNASVTFSAQKVDCVVWVRLTPKQEKLYEDFLDSEEVYEALNQTRSPLAAILVLRKICNDTRLLLNQQPDADFSASSAKMQVLFALLQEWCVNKKHKTVVFSQSKKVLNFVQEEVSRRWKKRNEFSFLRVDGDVKLDDRANIIRAFNKDSPLLTVGEEENGTKRWDCLFLTTGVGAFGIELQGANRVILFEPHWNPCVDDQAVDRCFRIGQTRSLVQCYRLVTFGTVEEKMNHCQVRKTTVARNILSSKLSFTYSATELQDLFTLECNKPFPNNAHQLSLDLSQIKTRLKTEDFKEVESELRALNDFKEEGENSSSLILRDLHRTKVVLGTSERSGLFLENSSELSKQMENLSVNELQEMDKVMENAMKWISTKQHAGGV